MIVNGEVVFNKPENQDSVEHENNEFLLMGYDTTTPEEGEDTSNQEDEEYTKDLYNRLREAVETTKRLDANYAHYDTNSQWTYSNPPPSAMNDPTVDEMVQHAALDSDRQRLLTGSYAVWQWYDRNNLASPGNIDFKKLSRVNYAFFQMDGDGYIFGTDRLVVFLAVLCLPTYHLIRQRAHHLYCYTCISWADPNVLFGPYDFSQNSDKLPSECKGGRGKDMGNPKNATVDKFAIYGNQQPGGSLQQPQGGGGNNAGGGNNQQSQGGEGNGANQANRQTQNSFKYPDFTKDPPCKFFELCHRNFPNSKTCNVHSYKEGLIYNAHIDGAQGSISHLLIC
jgi:hypothetical protein